MPPEIQEKMVHSLPGFENAKILKYGYAIEYDAIYPTQLKASLETKVLKNLYTAGQINGTSGYEEAACQGLMAGINASLNLEGKDPFVLKRSDAYIGVLIDDLITKGIRDPYRLLTSRAEFRLLLRSDNADLRLRRLGYEVGMISEEQINRLNKKEQEISNLLSYMKETKLKITPKVKEDFERNNYKVPTVSLSLEQLIKRPEIKMGFLSSLIDIPFDDSIKEQIEINLKYEGYIAKAYKEAEKMLKLEKKQIPEDIDYDKIKNIASEARQKLKEVRPTTIAQAIRISGVNPSDISILTVYLKKEYGKNE
jgi:tRNA uridine 5-carboxymethylaminomethyl modification enzyme